MVYMSVRFLMYGKNNTTCTEFSVKYVHNFTNIVHTNLHFTVGKMILSILT